jgi:hypothetical protein
MAEHPNESQRRAEWDRIRRSGVWPWALQRGLARGIPMGLLILVALELVQGRTLDARMFTDPALLGRLALAIALFSVGGAVSAYARWRALDLRFGPTRAED